MFFHWFFYKIGFFHFGLVFNPPYCAVFMAQLGEKIKSAIVEYNMYRVNIVEAELREQDDAGFKVFFDGSFCETCGYYDYYDDLLVLLEDDYGVISRIVEINHVEEGDLVRFELVLDDSQSDF